MKFYPTTKTAKYFISCVILFLIYTPVLFSQSKFTGKIINVKDGKPVAFATIALDNARTKVISDVYGNFSLLLDAARKNDSLLISSIGYRSLRLPVQDAMLKKEFALYEEAKELQPVVIYSKDEETGSKSEITGYFRAWNTNNTGGEIGKVFEVGHRNFKLERVRFKLNNRCDTCLIRLHVREVLGGYPGEDLLTDSISTMVHRLAFDDKLSEFDLRPYNITLKKSTVFVGMEVLSCSQRAGDPCSLCFIGTEEGDYMYKSKLNSDWEEFLEYSIYLRIFYKY